MKFITALVLLAAFAHAAPLVTPNDIVPEGTLVEAAHDSTGANTCDCGDGITMTCACTGIATPTPATHDSTGANTCDCGDGTMTCACTGIATPPPATHDSTGANTCDCGDGT